MPITGLDPRAILANALAAQSGVYALLLGSGVSTGAGIPTGWGVVKALTRRLALAANDTVGDEFDPDQWWDQHGDGNPLGYSGLLAQVAPTPAARRQMLAKFFQASDDDRENERKVPGPAHHAIAELARRGTVRVIIETNFDRLVEQALAAAGVPHQVVDSPGAIKGMEPLTHANCTVIKLHGDYARLDQLNTVEELSTYATPMARLLRRVLDEYGLVVNGWSGDWDHALVDAIKATQPRRYPLFWLTRSLPLGAVAGELVERHRAVVVPDASADRVFPDLVARLEALDTLTATPLSQEIALTQLKRWLPNPLERIRLRDLLMDEVEKVATVIRERPQMLLDGTSDEQIEAEHTRLANTVSTLTRLISAGVYFDRDDQHTDLWVEVLQRMLQDIRTPDGTYQLPVMALDRYPALLVMYAGVAGALGGNHEDVAVRILTEPVHEEPFGGGTKPACDALHPYRVLDKSWIDGFPSSGGIKWRFSQSHLIRHTLSLTLTDLVGEAAVKALLSRTELRVALAEHLTAGTAPAPGEFILDGNWDIDPAGERRLRWIHDLVERGNAVAWATTDPSGDLEVQVTDLETIFRNNRHSDW